MELESSVIDTLLQNANFAPNHHSNYPWRFVVIQGAALDSWLDEAIRIYRIHTEEAKFKEEKVLKMERYKHQISHAIAIVLHREYDSRSLEIEDVCAVACAVQNMYLSLSEFPEAGGYWSTGLGTYSSEMKEFLSLKDNEKLMGYFICGHVVDKRTEGNRKSIDNFVRYL